MDIAILERESQVIKSTYVHESEGVLVGGELVILRGLPCKVKGVDDL